MALLFKMAFELDLKFTERLYLSDVSRQIVLYVQTPFILKHSWYLVVFAKERRNKSRLLVL